MRFESGRSGPFVLLVALLSGCGEARKPASPPLRLAVASDLQTAMPILVAAFRQDHGIEVEFTMGASGLLAQQIEQGAPFDLFLAANQSFVDDLAHQGLIRPDSVRPYAKGSLVLAVHREAGDWITGLDDLRKPGIKKIAIANPEFAPYGVAGKQALERAGLWTEIEAKIVQAETVRQALQFVQSGNAEVGLVGRAIADAPEVRTVAVDPSLYDPIVQGLGIVATSNRAVDAEAFARFLLGEIGQGILSDLGFGSVSMVESTGHETPNVSPTSP